MNPEPETNSEVRLPLTEHLEELRTRLIRSLAAMGVGTVLCYSRAEWPSVPGYPGGGSVRQPICQTLR